ncbi:MAG: hypothetical protein H6Q41_3805 [Deltaproteobacteria bacterium]|jgi:hypothetical protein|nr:hypothetical protein [Deltaproteobacteria bacterium]
MRLKAGAMKKVKILAILVSIFLAGCFASARSPKLRADLDGFKDIKWGTEISTLKDMEKVESDRSSNTDLVWYTRKGDLLAIGKAKLENIFYSFWMGTFEGVWIGFEGDENFETLKKELFERFGKVLESEELVKGMEGEAGREPSTIRHAEEFYAWWGKNMEMTLSYSRGRHRGTLAINSKKVSEERRTYEKQKRK